MIEMWLFSIIPRAMRVETNSGQEKVEHLALSMLNHFKNRCDFYPKRAAQAALFSVHSREANW
jgi:hypothetical protein